MTTYQWIGFGLAVMAILGTAVSTVGGIVIVWLKFKKTEAKTEGIIDLKMKAQGERLGNLENNNGNYLSKESCVKCKDESNRLGGILIQQNEKDHLGLSENIEKLYDRTGKINEGVTKLAGKFDGIEKFIRNGHK